MPDQTEVFSSTTNGREQERFPLLDKSEPVNAASQEIAVIPHSSTSPWLGRWRASLALLTIGIVALPLSGLGLLLRPFQQSIDPKNYALRAERILSQTPLIDGHNDLPHIIQIELYGKMTDGKFNFNDKLLGHTDVQRMRKGQMGGQFWSVFVECAAVEKINDPTVSLKF